MVDIELARTFLREREERVELEFAALIRENGKVAYER